MLHSLKSLAGSMSPSLGPSLGPSTMAQFSGAMNVSGPQNEDLSDYFSAVQTSTTAPAKSRSEFAPVHFSSPQGGRTRCPICERSFKKPWNLKVHYQSKHLGLRPHKCLYPCCSKIYSRKHDLKRHMQQVHGFELGAFKLMQ
ncbi:hypothetical protein C8Q76DRAFT_414711 [Earliella scabrosa]|nr:hypothetical protein C8Q76DRAFT_414711 [Earliella scabrosa]